MPIRSKPARSRTTPIDFDFGVNSAAAGEALGCRFGRRTAHSLSFLQGASATGARNIEFSHGIV